MNDDLITAKEAGAHLSDASGQSVRRMMREGVVCGDGSVVRLKFVRLSNRNLTRRTWIESFIDKIAERNASPASSKQERQPSRSSIATSLDAEDLA